MRMRTRARLVPFTTGRLNAGLVVAVALMAGGCSQGSVQYRCTQKTCVNDPFPDIRVGCFDEGESSIDQVKAELRTACTDSPYSRTSSTAISETRFARSSALGHSAARRRTR